MKQDYYLNFLFVDCEATFRLFWNGPIRLNKNKMIRGDFRVDMEKKVEGLDGSLRPSSIMSRNFHILLPIFVT